MAVELAMDKGTSANLILVALVRKLIEKNVLSEDDVCDLSRFAAGGPGDVAGDRLTPEAARA